LKHESDGFLALERLVELLLDRGGAVAFGVEAKEKLGCLFGGLAKLPVEGFVALRGVGEPRLEVGDVGVDLDAVIALSDRFEFAGVGCTSQGCLRLWRCRGRYRPEAGGL